MKKRVSRYALALLALAATSGSALCQSLAADYAAVLRPTLTRTAIVEEAEFNFCGLRFSLHTGGMALAAPVRGQVTAAVFIGRGEVDYAPPNDTERQQLALFDRSGAIHEPIDEAVFRFADASRFLQSVNSQLRFRQAAPGKELFDLLANRARAIESTGRDDAIRLLNGLDDAESSSPGAGVVFMELHLSDGRWLAVDYDPLQAEPFRIHARRTVSEPLYASGLGLTFTNRASNGKPYAGSTLETGFDDTWSQSAPDGPGAAAPWTLQAYKLSARMQGSTRLDLVDTVTAATGAPASRGLLLVLNGNFRVANVVTAAGMPLEWLQAPDPSRASAAYEGDWLYLRWPSRLSPGQAVSFTVTCEGKDQLLTGVNGTNQDIKLLDQAWYPLSPFGPPLQRALFSFALEAPRRFVAAVASGQPQGGLPSRPPPPSRTVTFQWQGGGPLPAVGFTAPEHYPRGSGEVVLGDGKRIKLGTDMAPILNMDFMRQEIAECLRRYSDEFGDYPYDHLDEVETQTLGPFDPVTGAKIWRAPNTFSNIPVRGLTPSRVAVWPGHETPSWPMVVVENVQWPSVAVGDTAMASSPIGSSFDRQIREVLTPHIVAHQWWGHWVGWDGTHDRWLAEGLANASAWLFDQSRFGTGDANLTLAAWQNELTTRDAHGRIPEQLGPLWLGDRLASSIDPDGFNIVAFDKGGYVFEMLWEMLRETRSDGDQAIRDMMHAFTSTFGGHNASTADFQRIAEKYMSPAMDLDGDGHLDWFFREYVDETGIAKLNVESTLSAMPGGKTLVSLRITNPQHWRGLFPVYFVRDQTHADRVMVAVTTPVVEWRQTLDFAPTRIVPNMNREMLVNIQP